MAISSTCRVLLSGPFCVGKSTIIKRLEQEFGLKKVTAISTRAMRQGETQGQPYTFVTLEEFHSNQNNYFDPICFKGNHYAVLNSSLNQKQWVLDILSTSHDHYKERVPDAISIYIKPMNDDLLINRAMQRGDTSEQIAQRLDALKNEVPHKFDHIIEDLDDFEAKYTEVKKIIIQ